MMLRVLVFFYFILVLSSAFSEEIPVIVISAGKTPQSKSTVGSDVTVIDSKTLRNSNEFFIGDILDNKLNGMNYFQSGGYGTVAGIQLRGLPKRYSTVYVDGIKMSDPSSVSGEFELSHILTNSISRVEILKY